MNVDQSNVGARGNGNTIASSSDGSSNGRKGSTTTAPAPAADHTTGRRSSQPRTAAEVSLGVTPKAHYAHSLIERKRSACKTPSFNPNTTAASTEKGRKDHRFAFNKTRVLSYDHGDAEMYEVLRLLGRGAFGSVQVRRSECSLWSKNTFLFPSFLRHVLFFARACACCFSLCCDCYLEIQIFFVQHAAPNMSSPYYFL